MAENQREGPRLAARNLLLVDSDREFLRKVERFLGPRGYNVLSCRSGTQALKKISSLPHPPQLALVSLKLPDLAGEVFLKKLKEIVPDLGIFLTDWTEEDNFNCIQYGVLDIIPKPLSEEALLSVVEKPPTLIQPLNQEGGKEGTGLLAQFFPFLVHELRNPLQAIGGALTIIEKRTDMSDQPLAQSIQIIKEEVQHLIGFVQRCLDFVRPVNKDYIVEIDLNQLVLQSLKMATYVVPGTAESVEMATDLAPDLPPIYGNYEETGAVELHQEQH